jgi:hypothetical protein
MATARLSGDEMQIMDVRSDTKFTYATVLMAHGLTRKFRAGRSNGSVQIAMAPPHAALTWHFVRPEIAETIRCALKDSRHSRTTPKAA